MYSVMLLWEVCQLQQPVFQLLLQLLQLLSDRRPQRLKLLHLQPANKPTNTNSSVSLPTSQSEMTAQHVSVCRCESPVGRAQVFVDQSLLSDDWQLQVHHLTAEQVQTTPFLLKVSQRLKTERVSQVKQTTIQSLASSVGTIHTEK